jgi:predicted metal-dependent hydrolase
MDFEYTIKESPRARHIRLSVSREGKVVATKPRRAPLKLVEAFIESKRAWVEDCLKRAALKKESGIAAPTRQDYLANRYKFQRSIRERLERLNAVYGFSYKTVSVKNTKTRLGSCSRRGNLNFSYQLSVYPDEVIDYVVVHELCHLKEFNHSKSFWALVAMAVPDYRRIRRIIKVL